MVLRNVENYYSAQQVNMLALTLASALLCLDTKKINQYLLHTRH